MSAPPPSIALTRFERWLLPTCAVAALIIGIVGIGRFLRLDEANSVIIASSGMGRLLEYLRNDNNLPFYYVMLHGWIRAAGISEWAVHLPSVLFYWVAIGTTYLLGREVSGSKAIALYSSLFYLVSLQAIHQAQKTRMYSLLGLMASLSTLFFFRSFWRETARKRDWIWYVVVNALGTFVHVWYFFLLLAQAVTGLFFRPKKVGSLAAAQLLAVLPFALLWARNLPQQAKIGAVDWMPQVRARFFVSVFGEFYGGDRWGLLFLAAAIAICVWGARNKASREQFPRRPVAALATVAVLCLMVPLLFSFIRPIYWPGRYTMIALPALAVALGCSVASLAAPRLRTAFAYCAVALILALHIRDRHKVFENSSNVYVEAQSDKAATLQLCRSSGPTDIFAFTGLARAGVEYYLRRLGCERDLTLLSVPADTAEHLGWARATGPSEVKAGGEKIAKQFLEDRRPDEKLWLIPAHGRGADENTLTAVLDQQLGAGNRVPLQGSFFDEVIVYDHNPERQTKTEPDTR